MRLTLRQLQIYLAVARTGSTVAAGKLLSLSQSATSAALNELEFGVGAPLFDRVGKRLLLNDNGRTLLPQARQLVDGARSIQGMFGPPGQATPMRLQIGASTTLGNYVIPPLIASFHNKHPIAQLHLQIGNTREITAAVAAFEIDIGFIEGPCHEQQVRVVPWVVDDLVIVCAPRHRLAHHRRGAAIGKAALREELWLLREPGSGTREAVENALLPHLRHLPSVVQMGSAEAIRLAASEGLGLACLSRRVVEDFVALGRLRILRTTLPPLRREFSIVLRENKLASQAVEKFIAHCRSDVRRPREGAGAAARR
jgi:DNA-binding transcriptional LysR family regulator